MKRTSLSALLALALCSVGCPRPPVQRPYPPPTGEQLVAALQARAAHTRTLRIEAKVDYFQQHGDRVKVGMFFLVERPAKLRIDADSPVGGGTLASLATDGKDFQLLDVEHNRFLVGEATPCNIARLVQVRLRPEDVVEVLGGGAPLPSTTGTVSWDPNDGGREVLTLTGEGGQREVVKLDAQDRTWDVRSVEVYGASNQLAWRVTHDDYHDEGGTRVPATSHVEEPARQTDVRIRYRSREINPPLPANAFHLDAPSGIAPETVTCDQ